MKIATIILHFGNIALTKKCIRSLLKADINRIENTIIIINNDSSVDISGQFPYKNIYIIQNTKNVGFAKGVNQAIDYFRSKKTVDYFIFLNNDTIVPDNFFELVTRSDFDIVGPIIKFQYNKKWIYDFGGVINWTTGRTKHRESFSIEQHQMLKAQQSIDYVSGCCMAIRREVFEKIGLFDPDFFFYFEDVDFCVRAVRSGFQIGVNPQVIIYHALSSSIGRFSNKAIYYNVTSNLRFITKHLGWRRLTGYFYLFVLSSKIVIDRIRKNY
jgi:GT2 family glycosyltransferase